MLGLKAEMYKIVGLAILDLYFNNCVELVIINVDLMDGPTVSINLLVGHG